MPRKPPQVYNVCRASDGCPVVLGVPLGDARGECARLNAEARLINPETSKATSMFRGEPTSYEVVTT